MNFTYISRESPLGSLDPIQFLPHLFVVPPAVHVESLPTYDIRNRSVFSCIFGFYNFENNYETALCLCSAIAILPIIGGVFSLMSCMGRGAANFITHPDVNKRRAFSCGFLMFLRILLSCLGLGFLFFLLDLLYALCCYLERK